MMKIIAWLLTIPSAFVRGWAIKVLWLWFMVPATGLKPLSGGCAYGLALITTALTLRTADLWATEEAAVNDKRIIIVYPLATTVLLAYVVGIGWVVKTYFL